MIALEIVAVVLGGFRVSDEPKMAAAAQAAGPVLQYSNTKALGQLMYTEYLFPVEIAAAILLVAMIAAIALTLRQRKDSKHISPSLQVHVKPADRLTVLKVAATQPAVAPQPAAEPEEKKA